VSQPQTFKEKFGPTALVIGGSEGLGAEFARALASRGLDLVLVARRGELLEKYARELEVAHSIRVRTFALDVSELAAQEELLRSLEGIEIGLVVCNAAVSPVGPFLAVARETHERLLNLNCRLAALLAHALGSRMAERGRGGIILISSMAGFQGTAQVVHYSASKAYLRVLAEGLWEELRGKGVAVLGCCCGQINTPTFVKTEPRHPAWMPVPVMEAAPIVAQALAALGKQPTVIPGLSNRLATFVTQRLLPRRATLALYSASTRAMYPPPSA
jgi:short-subunit dehydrogenase